MAADKMVEKSRRQQAEASQWLRRDLLRFAREERFAEAFAAALPLYWNGLYTIENGEAMSQFEAFRFFDWFVFDYKHGDEPRLIDVYYDERRKDLAEHQRGVLDAWLSAPPAAAYELVSYEGQVLRVRDFVNGDAFEVYESGGRGAVEPGDLLLGRLVPVQDQLQFSTVAAYLPQDEITDLRDKLDQARAADAERHPDSSYVDFMRRNGHLVIHHALEQAELKGRPPVANRDPDRSDDLARRAAQQLRKLQKRRG